MSDFASMLELDLPGETFAGPTPTPEDPADECTVEGPTVPEDYGAIDSDIPLSTWTTQVMAGQGARDLIEAERAACEAAGIHLDDKALFYAAGTALAGVGHNKLRALASEYNALPGVSESVQGFQAEIATEHRHDGIRDLADYRIGASGRLVRVEDIADPVAGLVMPSKGTAWRQITEIAGDQNINRGLSTRTRAERRVRTRDVGAGREVYGIVSTDPVRGYAVLDGPQVADLVLQALKSRGLADGAKMEITYDRATTRYSLRAVVQAQIDIPALWGVGRIHQAYVQVDGGDDGMRALRGSGGAVRIQCLNASRADVKGLAWTRSHKGNVTEIRALVASMVDQFGTLGESLRSVWSTAAAHHYLDTDGTQLSVSEAITRLIAHKHIPDAGLEPEQALDRYMAAWREEDSPTSAAGILMAVQRAAHEGFSGVSRWATADVEEAASNLLYQPVWTLDEVRA